MEKEQEQKLRKVQETALFYYSRKDIQQVIYDFCKNRETVPRYLEGFGKRPDALDFPTDIISQAKKGATSFHCSEEIWEDPLKISTEMSPSDYNKIRIGWDLCLPDFETIFIEDEGFIKKICMKELAEYLKIKDFGRFSINKKISIFSINNDSYNLEKDRIKEIIIRNKKEGEKLIKISVEDGKEIFVSEDHPVLVFTEGGIKQKEAKLLSTKDFLIIPEKLCLPENMNYLNLFELIKDSNSTLSNQFILDKSLEKIGYNKSKITIPFKIKLNYNFGKLIGYYLSEGSIDDGRIEFVFNKLETKEAEEVIFLCNEVFNLQEINKNSFKINKKSNSLKVRINSQLLSILFKEILGFGRGASKKKIPDWVYNSPKDFISGIITGYFIGDGSCIYDGYKKKSLRIDAVSASKELITGLSIIFMILGIPCNILKSYKPRLNIIRVSGEEGLTSFINHCSEFFEKKKHNLTLKEIKHPSKHSRYPPFFDKIKIKAIENRNKQINLLRAMRLNMRVNKDLALLAANIHLENAIKNKLFPIKIKKVEFQEYNGFYYDIETVKNKNFLQGDGIFTHNCIDIDSKYLDYSKIAADLLIKALDYHGVKHVGAKFSGSKGIHLIIPWKAFPKEIEGVKVSDMFPEYPRAIANYLQDMIHDKLTEKILQTSSKEDIEKKGKAISETRCRKCNSLAQLQKIGFYKCQKCKAEMQSMKSTRAKLRCVSCSGDMIKLSEQEIFLCSECKINSNKNPEMFETKQTAKALIDTVDLVLVAPRHLFRTPYSLHEKTALASVVIDKDKVLDFQPSMADPLKAIPRNFIPDSEEGEARELLMQALDYYKKKNKVERKNYDGKAINVKDLKISEDMFPDCIQKILLGIKDDGRKRALFILLAFLRSLEMPRDYIEQKVEEWNKKNYKPLMEGYIRSQITWFERNKIMPPNCTSHYYKELNVKCNCQGIKNPINYTIKQAFRAKRS